MLVRPATVDDAAACAAIYAGYVQDTAISFETEPPAPTETARASGTAVARVRRVPDRLHSVPPTS